MDNEAILARLNEISQAMQNNYDIISGRLDALEKTIMDKLNEMVDNNTPNFGEEIEAACVEEKKLLADVSEKVDNLAESMEKVNIRLGEYEEVYERLNNASVSLGNNCEAIRLHLGVIDKIKEQAYKQKAVLEEAISNPSSLGNINKSGVIKNMDREEYFIYCWLNNLHVSGVLNGKDTEMEFRKLKPLDGDSIKGKINDEKKVGKLFYKHIIKQKENGDMRSLKALEFYETVYNNYLASLRIEQ